MPRTRTCSKDKDTNVKEKDKDTSRQGHVLKVKDTNVKDKDKNRSRPHVFSRTRTKIGLHQGKDMFLVTTTQTSKARTEHKVIFSNKLACKETKKIYMMASRET